MNILSIEEKKDKTSYNAAELAETALKENEEIALAKALASTETALKPLIASESYENAMKNLASLRSPVDAFFEKIMVNAEDKNLRENRLRLLASIRQTMNQVADFSKIEG